MGKVLFTILFIVFLVVLEGCVSSGGYERYRYRCVELGKCSLPEKIVDGKALIYIIRPVSLFNNSEEHKLFVRDKSTDREFFIAGISGSRYCVYQAKPGSVLLIVKGGNKGDELQFDVVAGNTYYVLNKVSTSVTSFKLNSHLEEVEMNKGEKLLRDVAAKCVDQR